MQSEYRMKTIGLLCLVLVTLAKCQEPLPILDLTDKSPPKITVTLRALRPRGFRAYIEGNVYTTTMLFFDGIIYDGLASAIRKSPEMGILWGAATPQANGKWLFEDHNARLQVGALVRYTIFIPDQPRAGDDDGMRAVLMFAGPAPVYELFNVTELWDPSAPSPYCRPTLTKVRGRQDVCAGDVIFEDTFETLREDQWQVEQYIPTDHPEHPFVSYQRLPFSQNVFVENGNLHIVPKLQDDLMRDNYDSIETGTLDLTDGCTRSVCSKAAFGSDILPPVVSGRLTSIPFAFKYGIVFINAKIPRGDWLYPELLLVPLFQKFIGEKEMASIIKVVRVSDALTGFQNFNGWNMDQRCYDAGPHNISRTFREENSDGFHEFAIIWRPDSIQLGLDDKIYMESNVWWAEPCYKQVEPSFRASLSDYRHLSLGVAAGGTVFPDSITTDAGHAKPWRNGDHKASLKFWENKTQWLPTWTAPSLVIDSIKVVALN